MRDQYKLLAEKYQLIQENDKEDILLGLDDALASIKNKAYRFTYKNITAERYTDRSRYFAMRVEFPHSYATEKNIVNVPLDAKPLPPISPNEPFDNIYYRVAFREVNGPGIKIEIFIKNYDIIDLIQDYNGDDPVADLEFEIDNYCGDHDVLWRVHNLPEVKEAEHHFNPNTLKENDKEDIMAGLEELSVDPNAPVNVTDLMKLGFVPRIARRNSSTTFHRPDVTRYIIVWKVQGSQTWYVDTTQEYAAAPVYTPTTMGELEKAYNGLLRYINK